MGNRVCSRAAPGTFPARAAAFAVLFVVLTLLITACSSTPEERQPSPAPSRAETESVESSSPETVKDAAYAEPAEEATVALNPHVIEAQNRFGMLLFQTLAARARQGVADADAVDNVFLSPVSVALALGMAYNGAAGETEAAMAEALQLAHMWKDGLTRHSLNAANRALLDALTKGDDPHVHLNVANSVWHRRELVFNETFLRDNERFYKATVTGLDFDASESVERINAWVSDATEGRIQSVVDRLDADQIMVLINAVYFKGAWTTPFNPEQTRELPFRLLNGDTRLVPMMYREGRIDYYENGYQAVRLPYGDERLAMYVFLPPAGVDFWAFVNGLTYDELNDAFARFAPARGELLLPRVDVAFKANLNDALGTLGMGVAFDAGRADFSRMLPADTGGQAAMDDRNIYIGAVIHQSVLKMDEEGTEAAAVTSVDFRVTSAPVYDFRFRADRPFVLAVRDDATGALLFVGAVTDPAANRKL